MILLKRHKLELIEELKKSGINPADIKIKEKKKAFKLNPFKRRVLYGEFKITISNLKPYYFNVKTYILKNHYKSKSESKDFFEYKIVYSPGQSTEVYSYKPRNPNIFDGRVIEGAIKDIITHVKSWIKFTLNEVSAMDKIDSYLNFPVLNIYENNKEDNEYFSTEEKLLITSKIEQIKKQSKTDLKLDKSQIEIIDNKLNEIIEKLDKLNKFDFKSSLYGVLMNIGSSIIYDKAGLFFSIVKQVFGSKLLN